MSATKWTPNCANNGGTAIAARVDLTQGKWLLVCTGYSPIAFSNNVLNQATVGYFSVYDGSVDIAYSGVSLLYEFCFVRYAVVTSDTAKIDFMVRNWETQAMNPITNNYNFYAIRIA